MLISSADCTWVPGMVVEDSFRTSEPRNHMELEPMTFYWFSTKRMTVEVGVDASDRVRTCPPIVRGFTGQPVGNLRRWMSKQPGFIEHKHEL